MMQQEYGYGHQYYGVEGHNYNAQNQYLSQAMPYYTQHLGGAYDQHQQALNNQMVAQITAVQGQTAVDLVNARDRGSLMQSLSNERVHAMHLMNTNRRYLRADEPDRVQSLWRQRQQLARGGTSSYGSSTPSRSSYTPAASVVERRYVYNAPTSTSSYSTPNYSQSTYPAPSYASSSASRSTYPAPSYASSSASRWSTSTYSPSTTTTRYSPRV